MTDRYHRWRCSITKAKENGKTECITREFKWQTAVNIFILLAVLFAFYLMYFRSEGLLQAKGIAAFKYFTVLSNVNAMVQPPSQI